MIQELEKQPMPYDASKDLEKQAFYWL